MSFSILIFFIILMISTFLFFNFEREGTRMSSRISDINLQLADTSINKEIEVYRILGKELLLNEDIGKLMASFNFEDSNKLSSILQGISLYSNVYQSLNSVYVYSRYNDYIYCTDQQLSDSSDNFFDKDIVAILKSLKGTTNKIYLRRLPSYLDQNNSGFIYSFLYIDFNTEKKVVDSAIIVNVNIDQMIGLLNKFYEGKSKIICMDTDGLIKCSPEVSEVSKNFSKIINEKLFEAISVLSVDSASQVVKINGIKYLASFTFSQNIGWYVVSLTPYNMISSQTEELKYLTLFISLVLLTMSVFAVYLISKFINVPIKAVINKNKEYEAIKSENIIYFRREILQNILMGTSHNNPNVLKDFNINIQPDSDFLMIMIKLDNTSSFLENNSLEDRRLLLFSVGNIAGEIFLEKFPNEPVQFDDGYVVLIINLGAAHSFSNEELKQLADKTIDSVNKFLKLSVSLIIGGKINSIKNIPDEYYALLEKSKYNIVYDTNSVIFSDEIVSKQDSFNYPDALEKGLFDAILKGNLIKALDKYHEMTSNARQYSYETFAGFLSQLMLSINSFVLKYETTIKQSFEFNLFQYLNSLSKSGTQDEINMLFTTLITDIYYSLTPQKGHENTRDTVRFVEEFIQSNFSDPNLSVNLIADKLNRSSAYLGRVYRKVKGKTILDLITETRMNSAIEQLLYTNKKIEDICNSVGILNEKYFYVIFKKQTGITPNDYKLKFKNKKK